MTRQSRLIAYSAENTQSRHSVHPSRSLDFFAATVEIEMSETVLPGFISRPDEGSIIGRILAGYGELEMELCACVCVATGDLDAAIKALFRLRGEDKRIRRAVAMARDYYTSADLAETFDSVIEDLHWCRQIRNQYAHSQWYYTEAEGLCFVDLEHTARLPLRSNKLSSTDSL
jgi:hypothetical protein